MADKAIKAYQQIYGAEYLQTLNGMSGLAVTHLGRRHRISLRDGLGAKCRNANITRPWPLAKGSLASVD
jgi:hypothetical protein